jgi:MFS family permease
MITLALMLAVYGVVNTEQAGWLAASTLWPIGAAVALIAAFLVWESRIAEPLVPLDLFRLRNHSVANVVGVLWAAAMFAWFFLTALYLQLVLGYEPLGVGLAFLPSNLIMAAFSWSLSAKLVTRFGIRAPLAGGLALAAAGLALLALAPVEGEFWLHILPPMLLLGTGAGMAFNPVLLAAMNDVGPDRAGLASGVVNTAFMMGGALGLAVLVSVAASVTAGARAEGASLPVALTSGYQSAFWIGAASAALASALAATLLRTRPVDAAAVAAAH